MFELSLFEPLEPRRLFRRYVLGIPVFFSHVMEARVRGQAGRPEGAGRS